MMPMTKKILIVLTLSVLCMALVAPAALAELTVQTDKDTIDINYNYNGSTLNISGTSDAGTDLIITIASDYGEETLKKKDKIGGIIWMNVDEYEFSNIPNVYLIKSSKALADLLGPQQLTEKGLGLKEVGLQAEIEPEPSSDEKELLLDEFAKYKETKNLFAASAGDIEINQEGGKQTYSAEIDWPYQAPPGQYQITVYSVEDGLIFDTAETQIAVQEVGAVKSIANMAADNGALYGLIAIVIAIVAGFGVGIVFRSKGGSH